MSETPGLRTITLKLDQIDFDHVQMALAIRQNAINLEGAVIPDACHDDANLAGRLIAEICRNWIDCLHALNDLDDESDGEEWKAG